MVVVLIAAALVGGPTAARAVDQTCFGLPPTTGCKVNGVVGPCVGTDGNDRIDGTPGDDVIIAGGGNDVVKTGKGDDVVCGGPGDDDIRKNGKGSIKVDGGPGRDRIRGGASADVLLGGPDDDKIFGGKGDDTILCGGDPKDAANGGPGRDACACARKKKCETTPAVLPTTSTTTVPGGVTTTIATTSTTGGPTTSSTSTTLCVPRTCNDAGAECGTADDGCSGILQCGSCPVAKSLCVAGTCEDACVLTPDYTKCDSDNDACTVEYCEPDGVCRVATTIDCGLTPAPCYGSVTCNPMSGACEDHDYLGDLTPCTTFEGNGRCASGSCAVGKECVIDGVAYDVGDKRPTNPCEACQPGLDRATWTTVKDGLDCPGGPCASDACETDVCFLGNAIVSAGAVNPTNPCQVCAPNVDRRKWSPGANGVACSGGLCAAGACSANVCVIDGAVYANGARNPGASCQECNVSFSRTSWHTVPDNLSCGNGCTFGQCSSIFGGCVIAGTVCPTRACASGVCQDNGSCNYFPNALPGTTCTDSSSQCMATQGTCNQFGFCARQVLTGSACSPILTANPCLDPSGTGTCDAAGNCIAKTLPNGSPCTPSSPQPCTTYSCQSGTCQGAPVDCPNRDDLADGCQTGGVCNPSTSQCEYPPVDPYRRGTVVCQEFGQPEKPCCTGQYCAFRPDCDPHFCLGNRYCY